MRWENLVWLEIYSLTIQTLIDEAGWLVSYRSVSHTSSSHLDLLALIVR